MANKRESKKVKGDEKDFQFLDKILELSLITEIQEGSGERPTEDEGFMMDAIRVSRKSSCYNVHSGSVIVYDKRAIASGYNGAPPRVKNCLERGVCYKKERSGKEYEDTMNSGLCRGVHSEINALLNLNFRPAKDWASKLYTTVLPCNGCAKSLISSRLFGNIIFGDFYDVKELEDTFSIFNEADIKLFRFRLSKERRQQIDNRKAEKYFME